MANRGANRRADLRFAGRASGGNRRRPRDSFQGGAGGVGTDRRWPGRCAEGRRSEEHTSELQSLMRISYAVFCLKKKNTKKEQLIRDQEYKTNIHKYTTNTTPTLHT